MVDVGCDMFNLVSPYHKSIQTMMENPAFKNNGCTRFECRVNYDDDTFESVKFRLMHLLQNE